MIALARFRRGAARPRVRPVHRDAFMTDAALFAEVQRLGDEGRVVRLLRTRGPHQDVMRNGLAWLVVTVPRRWEPIGTYPTAAAALAGADAWLGRLLAGEFDAEDGDVGDGGFDGDAA